jgi:hypothetical protein
MILMLQNERRTIVIDSLDIAEVIVAGLIRLGKLPEPDSKPTAYEVSIEASAWPGAFESQIAKPTIYVRTK